MVVGVLKIDIQIPGASSLKQKRMILRSLKDKLRMRFNICISEIEDLDKWQKAIVGIASVNRDKKYLNSQLDKVLDFIDSFPDVNILDYELELY